MLLATTITIAVLGTLMLFILYLRIHTLNHEIELKRHRSQEAGMVDLLNYAAVVDDGVIVCKNGSLMAAWLYKGDDHGSSTDEQRNMVSFRINQAISKLGNGWMLHVDAARRPAQNYSDKRHSHFPDPVSAAIDEERRRYFESLGTMYEGSFVLTVTYFPPTLAQRKFVELMFDDNKVAPDDQTRAQNLLEQFKRDCANIEASLSLSLKLLRLQAYEVMNEDGSTTTYDGFLRWLQFCVTGQNHPIQLPKTPAYLDQLLGGQELWTGTIPKIGFKYLQVVAIEGFPFESLPGVLTLLGELSLEYRWSSRFIFMDTHEALSSIETYRKKWSQKIRPFLDQVFNRASTNIDQNAASMVADANAALADINSGLVASGYYTSTLVLMDEDREKLEETARNVKNAIDRLGFNARIETINTLDAFMGSLPGHGVENVRRPLINTLNLADFLPTSTIWTGQNEAPCPLYPPNSPALMHCVTHGSTLFRLNLHVNDLGHTLMIGRTGAGKSTHLALLAAQFRRYRGLSLYSFDVGMSMYAVTKGMRGQHFTVAANDGQLAFCPLQFLETRGDRVWAIGWIDSTLALNGLITTSAQRNEIAATITSMYQSGAKTLSEFCMTVQDKEIREALKPYTIAGDMGYLLDAEKDGLALSDFTTFEIEELMSLGDKYCLPVLLYLFRRIERSLKGQPAVILLDEAWVMFWHPTFLAMIIKWLKQLRKANCLLFMATQNMTDAAKSGILDIIAESTATKIFLPNIYALNEETSALYKSMGLNDRQIQILASAQPKREYYYVSENGRRLYDLALGPLALAFVGATDKESVAAIQKLEAQHGDNWIHEWLSIKGLSLDSYGVTA